MAKLPSTKKKTASVKKVTTAKAAKVAKKSPAKRKSLKKAAKKAAKAKPASPKVASSPKAVAKKKTPKKVEATKSVSPKSTAKSVSSSSLKKGPTKKTIRKSAVKRKTVSPAAVPPVILADGAQILHTGKHLSMLSKGGWEYVRRSGVSGVIGLVAVTPDQKLLLVEQFRAPVGKRVIELPAGLAGDVAGQEDEELTTAANRELEEETGYTAQHFTPLNVGPSSAGLTDETVVLYLAEGLSKVSDGGGTESEDIQVHEIPITDVSTWLSEQAQQGRLVDHKIYAGLYFLWHSVVADSQLDDASLLDDDWNDDEEGIALAPPEDQPQPFLNRTLSDTEEEILDRAMRHAENMKQAEDAEDFDEDDDSDVVLESRRRDEDEDEDEDEMDEADRFIQSREALAKWEHDEDEEEDEAEGYVPPFEEDEDDKDGWDDED